MEYKSQTEAVLAHLKKHGSITSMEAIRFYGVTRLSAVIYNLRRDGYTIVTEFIVVPTRYSKDTSAARYILKSEKE